MGVTGGEPFVVKPEKKRREVWDAGRGNRSLSGLGQYGHRSLNMSLYCVPEYTG